MLNRTILMGRLTADPELKKTPNGVSVTSFTLAVQRNYQKEQTDFIPIVAWRQTADFICQYFRKGQLIALEGSVQTRSYTDKNGNKRTAFEVVAEHVYFAESKKEGAQTGNAAPVQGTSGGFSIGDIGDYEEIETDGDLPF